MKTLNDYMHEATDYLYPEKSISQRNREIESILALSANYGLDKKFLKLVENDHEWQALAERSGVEYFVEVPKKFSDEQKKNLPSIEVLKLSCGKNAVIKFVCEQSF